MNNSLNKPAERNERLNSPLGLLGVPPDRPSMLLPPRSRLKLLILEADEAMMDDIIDAIFSATEGHGIRQ